MDGSQRGVDPFVVGRVGGIADTDQEPIRRKQAAATPSIHRLPCHFHVGGSQIFVDGGDSAVLDRGLSASITAYAEDFVAATRTMAAGRHRNWDNSRPRANADQTNIVLQIVPNQMAGDGPSGARREQIHATPVVRKIAPGIG